MQLFLEDIKRAYDAGAYSAVLSSILLVPDACGAVEFPDLRNGDRYCNWIEQFCPGLTVPLLERNTLWKIRNGMIHETTITHTGCDYDLVMFTLPNAANVIGHMNRFQMPGGPTALNLDLTRTCAMITAGAQNWLANIQGDDGKLRRLDGLIQLRPIGIPGVLTMPMIS